MTIKPLQWEALSRTHWVAKNDSAIVMTVLVNSIKQWQLLGMPLLMSGPTGFTNRKAAQAEAQRQWETFIRAAVEETPSLFPCPPNAGLERWPAIDNAGRDLS